MNDTYRFFNNDLLPQDFINKIKEDYLLSHLIVYVDKDINDYSSKDLEIDFDYTDEFYNLNQHYYSNHLDNQIHYNFIPFYVLYDDEHYRYNLKFNIKFEENIHTDLNILYFDIILKKQDKIYVIHDIHANDTNVYSLTYKHVIVSNVFNSLDEIKKYMILNSNLTEENINNWISNLLEDWEITFYNDTNSKFNILYDSDSDGYDILKCLN